MISNERQTMKYSSELALILLAILAGGAAFLISLVL
jgi:hypothetical protein